MTYHVQRSFIHGARDRRLVVTASKGSRNNGTYDEQDIHASSLGSSPCNRDLHER